MVNFSNSKKINREQLEGLYNDAEWWAYTKDLMIL